VGIVWLFSHSPLSDSQCIDIQILPPSRLIAGLMQLPMVTAAEGYGKFVADFETQGSGLGKPQLMRIGRLPDANEQDIEGTNLRSALPRSPHRKFK
jgi:hypothetical protein